MSINLSQRTQDIQTRFFDALSMLMSSEELKGGMREFCNRYNLNRTKYAMLKNGSTTSDRQATYRTIDIDALSYLCTDFNISAKWLLTGVGNMRRKNAARK